MKITVFFVKLFKYIYLELIALLGAMIGSYPNTRFGYFLRDVYYRRVLGVKMGGNTTISHHGIIYTNAPIEIGDNLSLGRNATLSPGDSFGIIIGNNVGIAEGTFVRASNHDYTDPVKPFKDQGHVARKIFTSTGREASIIIEDDVWIGANSVILTGAKIGKGSIVGAGSVISSELPEYAIAVGNPARVIASRRNAMFLRKYFKFP